MNELEERERLNQQQRPPGFSGSGWVTSRVSVAQAIGEWCLTAGEICREKYEMMRWLNEWPVLLSLQLQKSLMKDFPQGLDDQSRPKELWPHTRVCETSYYPNVIADHHFSHGHRFPKWGYPKSPWVSIPVVMVIHDDWGYSRHVPGDEEHHRCGRCLWHGAPARWQPAMPAGFFFIPVAGELGNGLEVMFTSWLQDQRFWPSCVKHPSFIRNLRAKIWDLSCVKGIRDLTSPRFWLLKLQWLQLQGFNWESHQAGKGNWYGIVESKVGPERDPLVRQWMRDKTLVGWWSL